MKYTTQNIYQQAFLKKKENTKFINKLKLKKTLARQLDETVHKIHDDVFKKTNCLDCGNCCKTTSPIFKMPDIERLSKLFKVKTPQFIDEFLHLDKENDYVLNSTPCPFLHNDNSCSVYDHRPTACQEYPHTDRKKVYQLLDLTLANTYICPATFEIVERLKKIIEPKFSDKEVIIETQNEKRKRRER